MRFNSKSIRTFLGSKNFKESREFYTELGFIEKVIDSKMSYFQIENSIGFYLQDYYVKDWVQNSMVFLEVQNLLKCHSQIIEKKLDSKYNNVRITSVRNESWGNEFHLIDPSGILWHYGEFLS